MDTLSDDCGSARPCIGAFSFSVTRSLEKKYSSQVTTLKKITPHKLRSTYGTQLYRETGDIYLVADVLGHSDVNTTKKHYAAIEDERRRRARNKVTLRDSSTSPADDFQNDMQRASNGR